MRERNVSREELGKRKKEKRWRRGRELERSE